MTSQEMGILEIKTKQKSAKLVNPSKGTLTHKTVLVDFRIEKSLASTFDRFTIALVFSHVGDNLMIETDFSRIFVVKRVNRIEESPLNS